MRARRDFDGREQLQDCFDIGWRPRRLRPRALPQIVEDAVTDADEKHVAVAPRRASAQQRAHAALKLSAGGVGPGDDRNARLTEQQGRKRFLLALAAAIDDEIRQVAKEVQVAGPNDAGRRTAIGCSRPQISKRFGAHLGPHGRVRLSVGGKSDRRNHCNQPEVTAEERENGNLVFVFCLFLFCFQVDLHQCSHVTSP